MSRSKQRGNGQGTAFRRGRTWTACITVDCYVDEDGKTVQTKRTKGGFATKTDALNYLSVLRKQTDTPKQVTFKELYDLWHPTHKATKKTMSCYESAILHFKPIWQKKIASITVDDVQGCIDDCTRGKRTWQNMKTLCGLLYKYGIPRGFVPSKLNMSDYITVRGGELRVKDGLPLDALAVLEKAASAGDTGATYVVCQCYLGFRPSELLDLQLKDYDRQERCFTGGAKTDAGKNRIVTISPKIQTLIDRLTVNRISGYVFGNESGKRMTLRRYRSLFYETLERYAIDNPIVIINGEEYRKYTPHSCRHTFATLMKNVEGADKDKLRLIGHTDVAMLRHYQDVGVDDLRKITDQL